ncbi:C39 family peptidase [Bacillus sp. PS06]|uniref:C39 family peptidase n=1 Tax=Bacillus sp. PS06 TaxID=2764176 RepID=UPI0017851A14|nr:C39 family peptidase [Bacillus sp. PS06]MBD8069098.1 C39 family peptidase [Bacillus sp. PS06]
MKNEVRLHVPLINQLPELPTGCEITAVTMMLHFEGAMVDKVALAKEMPKHDENPNEGYVGDPFTSEGWTIYPQALVDLVKKYLGRAIDLTGTTTDTLREHLANNKPVVVLVSSMHGFTVHALTLTGFDQEHFYFNDPWTGERDVQISSTDFEDIWNGQQKRALSY